MKKDLNGLSGNLGKAGKLGCGGVGMFGKLRTAMAVFCLGLYIILCGVGGSGFVSPALAGENGTLLWWGRGNFAWEFIDRVREDAEAAKVDLIINEDGETLAQFLSGQNISGLDAPVVLYWVPDHGTGWKDVGGYTLNEVSAMVQEAVGVLGGQKLDVTMLGPCYAGNIETMSCFAGLTKKVLATSVTSYVGLCTLWLGWLERTGDTSFENYVQTDLIDRWFRDYGAIPEHLADPEKLLALLAEIRKQNVPTSVFQNLSHHSDYPSEANDVWKLAEYCGVTDLLKESSMPIVTPDSDLWGGYCFSSCWSGENREQYLSTVPEANRCIPGSSVTPDPVTPTPAPGNAGASGGGGGCTVGVHNFPAFLLLIPLTVVMMKKGKK